jgi:hypothetical protein
MPIGEGKTFISEAEVDILRWRWRLREHPNYPESLWPTYDSPASFVDAIFSNRKYVDEMKVLKRTKCPGRRHRGALLKATKRMRLAGHLRTESMVYQFWDGPKTPQQSSALGRIGIVSIIKERLAEILASIPQAEGQPRGPLKVSTGELARFLSNDRGTSIFHTEKLLTRLENGCFVGERAVAGLCERLGIHFDDVLFVQPVIYEPKKALNDRRRQTLYDRRHKRDKFYLQTRCKFPPKLPAEPWIGSEPDLHELIVRDKTRCKVESHGLDGLAQGIQISHVMLRLSEINEVIVECRRLPREHATSKLKAISVKLADSDLAAWVSYIPGSGDRDPDGASRLIITIDKYSVDHHSVKIEGLFSLL